MRLIEAGEEERFVRSVMVPFLDPPNEEDGEELAHWVSTLESDRAWVQDDRGRFVANGAIDSMDLTVPGGGTVKMAGVTAVGVHPTHRRRGFLTQMMALMLSDARRRGEPVAGLLASESVIYGRFGFGHATDDHKLQIRSDRSAFTRPGPDLELSLLEKDEALKVLPELFDRCRRARAGEPNRTVERWEWLLKDRARIREGGRASFLAACDEGFVRYRVAANEEDLLVEDLMGTSPEVEAGLWRFVLDIDLIDHVVAKRRPVDEPVRWRLADPRQLEVKAVDDYLYLRVLDVAAALEARRYHRRGRLVLEITQPPVAEEQDPGRWVLDAGPGGAECRRATASDTSDLRMEITDLGSIYLGGFKPSTLAAAGRVEELTAGSLDVADAVFSTPLAPRTATGF
jgi:predicted acetyltransferase